MSLCLPLGGRARGSSRGWGGRPPLTGRAGDPELPRRAYLFRAQSLRAEPQGPASATIHSGRTLVGSRDPPATALVSLKPFGRGALKRSVSLRLALSHRLHLLILCARLSLPLSASDARSPSLQLWARFPSLCIHHAGGPAAFLTVHRLDCACQVGRCPPGSWGCR